MAPKVKRKPPPAFQFYPGDFLRDQNVMVMTLEETGAYIRLLCSNWIDESIPNDIQKLARICSCNTSEMERIWPAISHCFQTKKRGDNSRLTNRRLEAERKKQNEYRTKQQLNSAKRWQNEDGQDNVK